MFGIDEVRVYASDASGSAAPLRSMPLPALTNLLLSPARDEYHLRVGDTLETYALPAPAASGTLPLRTLTLPDSYDSIQFVDDVNGELWLGELELNVFDLTASGEAVSSRSAPYHATPVGGLGRTVPRDLTDDGAVSHQGHTPVSSLPVIDTTPSMFSTPMRSRSAVPSQVGSAGLSVM